MSTNICSLSACVSGTLSSISTPSIPTSASVQITISSASVVVFNLNLFHLIIIHLFKKSNLHLLPITDSLSSLFCLFLLYCIRKSPSAPEESLFPLKSGSILLPVPLWTYILHQIHSQSSPRLRTVKMLSLR